MAEAGDKVVVTTEYRGVFFGELVSRDGDEVTLKNCRNCVRWSHETKGFLGLAATGPKEGSRVGPAAPESVLSKATSITKCSPEAAQAWEAGPWF